jgi:agmatine deiminase
MLIALFVSVLVGCVIPRGTLMPTPNLALRVPAEWEPHAATWMQWPGQWEAEMRPAFADIINVVQDYEPVHLITSNASAQQVAQQFLAAREVPETNLTWHIAPVDNSWLRDNGPVYVANDNGLWIQNWRFDAWGGNFGEDIPYVNDNEIPVYIGQQLGMRVKDHQDYVLERGNLEFNGTDTLVLNWDCQDDRNPGLAQAEHEAILTAAFGVSQIIWAYGHDPEDGTTGHIDGTARFVDPQTLVVADYEGSATERELAISAADAGLTVVRYPGDPNWVVGNGFVAAMADGDRSTDAQLKAQLESLFPDRDIYMIDASTIADAGGGIHCVTSDQPASV